MYKRIVTIIGARPQFIKSAPVSHALAAEGIQEYLLHTGQHYDYGMSQVFFDELGIQKPNINLCVGSATHAEQTAEMLAGIEQVLQHEQPDGIIVYGDTNSTLAGALAAAKLRIPITHIEAGLRSYNKAMPEEINRVLTDHCAELLFCPTQTAVSNLEKEGITRGVHFVGDVMYDSALHYAEPASSRTHILNEHRLTPGKYLLATIHRPYNTDDPSCLNSILRALSELDETVILPVHPRMKQKIAQHGLLIKEFPDSNLIMIDPVSYLDMLILEKNSKMILTDSGGVQKEAYFFGIPCLTLRTETEWIETLEGGWNRLVQVDSTSILHAVHQEIDYPPRPPVFGDGNASRLIADILSRS
ncbi:MAG: UDP-N-acetylglucosamine 2-epimerase (non-hydrolyzing) [Chloroflexota bacterium]|nr:UDP-N-acetylglucosamine 2-epimerase (non-hydrolyzing) [Chloroflexota bacterium]